MKSLYILALLITVAVATPAQAKRLHKEKWYQGKYCQGVVEHRLPDRTRVDCLTETHAIEYDFGSKWAEAIGQALYYAFQTNKRAGVVLIIEKPKHLKYWYRLNSVIDYYKLPIDTWKVEK